MLVSQESGSDNTNRGVQSRRPLLSILMKYNELDQNTKQDRVMKQKNTDPQLQVLCSPLSRSLKAPSSSLLVTSIFLFLFHPEGESCLTYITVVDEVNERT